MDVLRPPLVRIGNRYYRKISVANKDLGKNPEEEDTDFAIIESCYNDEVCDANCNIEEYSGGFRIRLDIPSAYYAYIIGKRGETKRRIEVETKTQIRVPSTGEKGEIVLQGHDKKSVVSAKTRIEVMVDSARKRQPFTHFLSIPIQSEDIVEKFEDFKFNILDDDVKDSAVDTSIFQNPQKLHMTLGTLVLLSQTEIQRARDLLSHCLEELVKPMLQGSPLFVDIQGLEYMNDDPAAVDVLYAKIQPGPEADNLQMLVDRLVEKFVAANLIQRQYERVKLHITVMNTLFRKDTCGTSEPQRNPRMPQKDRESFNAVSILEKFGKFGFGSYNIDRIELSQRHSTSQSGYYESSARLTL